MARKKTQKAKRTQTEKQAAPKPEPVASPADSVEGWRAVVVEEHAGQLRVVAEAVTAMQKSRGATVEKAVKPLGDRLKMVEAAVRLNSSRIVELKSEMVALRRGSARKADLEGIDSKLGRIRDKLDAALSLEGRVAALEAKVG